MKLLDGKKALIFGVANKYSIAWGITQAFHEHGAVIGLSYGIPQLEKRVKPLADELGISFVEKCDVTKEEEITAVFAHNDDMALGAIKAIEEYGLKPGVDIKIVSVDATRVAFEAMIDGKLNATVECNPLLGPEFIQLALKVVNGESVPKWIPSQEGVFLADQAAELLPTRKY